MGKLVLPIVISRDKTPNSKWLFLIPEGGDLGTILAHSWHKFGTNDLPVL